MTKQVYEWSELPTANDFAFADGGWPEGMNRSAVNDAARANLSALRSWYNDMEWQTIHIVGPDPSDVAVFTRLNATQFTLGLSGEDFTPFFPSGRRIKIIDGGGAGVDFETYVLDSIYDAVSTTTVTLDTTGSMNAASSGVQVYFSKSVGRLAFTSSLSGFFIPETQDSDGIFTAIALCKAAGGGIVFLPEGSYDISETIDLSNTVAPVHLLGSGAVLDNNISGSGPMIHVDASTAVQRKRISGITLNIGSVADSVGIYVSSSLYGVTITDCQFIGGDTQIQVGSSGTPSLVVSLKVSDCRFHLYRRFGIANAYGPGFTAGNGYDVSVGGCNFYANIQYDMACAIKLTGECQIHGNEFENIGATAFDDCGLYLWEQSTTADGAQRCSVVGNSFAGSSTPGGGTGRGVYCRGSRTSITGNSFLMNSADYAIQVNAGAGVIVCDQNVISGNSIVAGNPVAVNRYSDKTVISGNLIECTNSGASAVYTESEGSVSLVSNSIIGGLWGVSTGVTSVDLFISCNRFEGQVTTCVNLVSADDPIVSGNAFLGTTTNGVVIGASCTNAVIRDNEIGPSITNGIVNSSTTTTRRSNELSDLGPFHYSDSDTDGWTGTAVDVSSITALDLPGGGGVGTYEVCYTVACNAGAVATGALQVHCGTVGDKTDTVVLTSTGVAAGSAPRAVVMTPGSVSMDPASVGSVTFDLSNKFTVTNDTWTKFGCSVIRTAGGVTGLNFIVYHFSIRKVTN